MGKLSSKCQLVSWEYYLLKIYYYYPAQIQEYLLRLLTSQMLIMAELSFYFYVRRSVLMLIITNIYFLRNTLGFRWLFHDDRKSFERHSSFRYKGWNLASGYRSTWRRISSSTATRYDNRVELKAMIICKFEYIESNRQRTFI